MSSYYDLLEIHPEATPDEMTKAFRKLALKYHPDKNPEAGDKFGVIAKAYKILSDPETRRIYDVSGEEGVQIHAGTDGVINNENFTWSDFEQLFRQFELNKRRGKDVTESVEVTLEEIYVGVYKKITTRKYVMCEGCKGFLKTCPNCNGYGETCDERCDECQGLGYHDESTEDCSKCGGTKIMPQMANYSIEIKPGTYNGQHIPILGEGDEEPGALAGDRIFVVKTLDHSLYQRVNFLDLATDVVITSAQKHARGGHDVILPTLDGSEMKIHLPEGITNGRTLEIPNSGLPDYFVPSKRGKLLVNIRKVQSPKSVSPDQDGRGVELRQNQKEVKRSSSFKRFEFVRNSFRGKKDPNNRKSMPEFRRQDISRTEHNSSMDVEGRSLNESIEIDFTKEIPIEKRSLESIDDKIVEKVSKYPTLPIQSKQEKTPKNRLGFFRNSFRKNKDKSSKQLPMTSTPTMQDVVIDPRKEEHPKPPPVQRQYSQEARNTPIKRKSKGFLTNLFFRR